MNIEDIKGKEAIVIRQGALGDVILTTGVLRHWQEAYGLRFTVITQRAYLGLFNDHPAVVDTIALERGQGFLLTLKKLLAIRKEQAGKIYIDLHGTLRSRLLGLLWKGPVFSFPKMSFTRRLFVRNHKEVHAKKLASATVTQRYALALDKIFDGQGKAPQKEKLFPFISISEEEKAWAEQELKPFREGNEDKKKLLVALHPFTSHEGKTWPQGHWRALMALLKNEGISYILVGQGALWADEEGSFINKTSIRELCSLLAACDIVVSGDSGPMHMADAVGTPLIALFGPTTQHLGFMPIGPHHKILERDMPCRPCSVHGKNSCKLDYACLVDIRPEDVLGGILLLTKTNEGQGSGLQQALRHSSFR